MKRHIRPAIIISLSLMLALLGAAITSTAKLSKAGYTTTAALFLQVTPTPTVEKNRSVVGSTDGIVVMGGIIVFIVLVPILVKRKSWNQTDTRSG